MKPLAIDLFCGLGGWTSGLLAEGYDVYGFDIEQHVYGEHRYPSQLVVQDVLTLHGSQFKAVDLIVASPPCQEFSYMAMPWSIAKEKRRRLLDGPQEDRDRLTALFDACFRVQREAEEAAGHCIPLVVENVRGAQEWVGRSRWAFGSFHLWGDVPALMPSVPKRMYLKTQNGKQWNVNWDAYTGTLGWKSTGMNWSDPTKRGQDFTRIAGQQAVAEGIKGSNGYDRDHPNAFGWKKPGTNSKSPARKFASAMIAKIPLALSRHIAATYKPRPSIGH